MNALVGTNTTEKAVAMAEKHKTAAMLATAELRATASIGAAADGVIERAPNDFPGGPNDLSTMIQRWS